MTVGSSYSAYSSYSSYSASSSQKAKPNFEDMAQQLLSSMDTDSNGLIDASEFSTAAQALATDSSSSSTSSTSDIFDLIDTNSDGNMSSEELMSALKNMKPPELPQGNGQEEGGMPPPPPPPPSDDSSSDSSSIDDIFSSLDTNQDGTISADEFKALFTDSTDETDSTSSDTQTQTPTKLSNDLLQKIMSYYGSDASNTNSTSLLSVSA